MTRATFEAAAAGAVEFDFDKSVLVTMALFIALMLILKPTLYDPMLKLFAEREERTEKTKERARKMDKKSAEALAEYDAAMAKARAAAGTEREKIRGDALRTENEILAKVRESTSKTLEDGRKKAQDEVARVRSALRTQAVELGRDVASRVLGREVPP
jgi:F-type H+-transporting ATPase subunit b